MSTPFSILLVTMALAAAAESVEFGPRESTWEGARRSGLDPTWILPSAPGATDQVAAARRLARARFSGEARYGEQQLVSFGDLVLAAARERSGNGDRDPALPLLGAVRRADPEFVDEWGDAVGELLRERGLYQESWDPEQDRDDDGIWFGESWSLEGARSEPWRSQKGSRAVLQGAVLIRADLIAIKEAENDYRGYPDRAGSRYEYIRAVPRSYLRGDEGPLGPFATLRLDFRCDLPFPFGDYDCDLRVLNRLEAEGAAEDRGQLVCDVYSKSSDFLWLAGRDVCVPVADSEGEWVATLLVRQFGFDLKGVPDGDAARQTSIRSGLGHLKRRAETLYTARGERDPLFVGEIPAFTVLNPD